MTINARRRRAAVATDTDSKVAKLTLGVYHVASSRSVFQGVDCVQCCALTGVEGTGCVRAQLGVRAVRSTVVKTWRLLRCSGVAAPRSYRPLDCVAGDGARIPVRQVQPLLGCLAKHRLVVNARLQVLRVRRLRMAKIYHFIQKLVDQDEVFADALLTVCANPNHQKSTDERINTKTRNLSRHHALRWEQSSLSTPQKSLNTLAIFVSSSTTADGDTFEPTVATK